MSRIVFVGQAMPRVKRNPHDWPTLNVWLYSIGLTDEQIKTNFLYSALVDYFPGSKGSSHIVPSHKDIVNEQKRLKKTVSDFNPEILVPIGSLSIAYCLSEKVRPLTNHIGNIYTANPYGFLDKEIKIIPLPHPSGASTWRHKLEHQSLLKNALDILKANLN